MSEASQQIVFFDIGDTLGIPQISSSYKLQALYVYPYIVNVLQQLKDNNISLGVISNTGNETEEDMKRVLEDAGIYSFFDPGLLIYSSVVGVRKPSPEIFRLAADKAGYASTPDRCLYVGEDGAERKSAKEEGWRVAPHPLLVWEILNGRRLRYIRVSVPTAQSEQDWRSALTDLGVVPLYITAEKGSQVYAISTATAAMRLDDLGFAVDRLGSEDDPLITEMYLLRDDRQTSSGFLDPRGASTHFFANEESSHLVLTSSTEGLFVALPGDRSVEDFHFEEAKHGHNLKLIPDPNLLQPFGDGNNARTASFLQVPAVEPSLSQSESDKFTAITPDRIRSYLERYAGIKPLNDRHGIIKSRHIHSLDMPSVTEALAQDLETIGGNLFTVKMDRFVHEGQELYNVEAELQGSESEEIVLVTAHLDSTAASDPLFDSKKDSAPGADDDASGIAAVLAIAEVIKELASLNLPKRKIRFVLFNAEEHGLVGSQAYARNQAALAAPIVSVYQMDMIGYNVKPPRSFEVHVGYSASTDVQNRSLVLAQRLDRLVPVLSPTLEQPQIYTQPDPAEGRSDHASFHQRGYAGCVISEDFFVGPDPSSPNAEPNPNYHGEKDKFEFVDLDYAADIARLVAGAAWITANL